MVTHFKQHSSAKSGIESSGSCGWVAVARNGPLFLRNKKELGKHQHSLAANGVDYK